MVEEQNPPRLKPIGFPADRQEEAEEAEIHNNP
jgi:hypothetical protein